MQTILLRTSERTLYKRCRQAWWWAFEDEIKTKTAAPALRFGSLVHQALERRYKPGVKRGVHPARTFKRLYAAELKQQSAFGFKDEDGKWEEAGDLGVAMLNNFVDQFGDDEQYEVIASEQAFQVEILRTAKTRLVYVGIFDGVWRDRSNGDVLLIDWKTAKSINTNHLPLDEQAGSYWAYGPQWLQQQGLLKTKDLKNMRGLLYTFLRKAKPDERQRNADGLYLNKDGSVSKQQPPPYFHREFVYRSERDAQQLRDRVISEAKEMQLVRRGKLDVYINPGAMNCAGCGFKDMCELKESGADWESYRDATMAPWLPYAEHELFNRG